MLRCEIKVTYSLIFRCEICLVYECQVTQILIGVWSYSNSHYVALCCINMHTPVFSPIVESVAAPPPPPALRFDAYYGCKNEVSLNIQQNVLLLFLLLNLLRTSLVYKINPRVSGRSSNLYISGKV